MIVTAILMAGPSGERLSAGTVKYPHCIVLVSLLLSWPFPGGWFAWLVGWLYIVEQSTTSKFEPIGLRTGAEPDVNGARVGVGFAPEQPVKIPNRSMNDNV
jgi:hypothetical protein